jgi:hypothetical protein
MGSGWGATEGPQQFLWRGRLWKVRAVLARWVETGPWRQSTGARAAIGSEDAASETTDPATGAASPGDLLTERERVEAGRGRLTRRRARWWRRLRPGLRLGRRALDARRLHRLRAER